MAYNEELWRKYVAEYDIDVPEEAVQSELEYIKLAMRHNMLYDRMSGGEMHLFPDAELREQEDELHASAEFEAKEPLVLKAIIKDQGLTATRDELEAEAVAVAQRQHSTVEELKRFFGDDLSMLARDVIENKARVWACDQMK